MEAVAGMGAVGAVGVFDYNRQNFLFDRKLRQDTEYQIMDFRIRQAELWREDVRDIIGLTAVKMDTYLVLNTVQLGFVVMAFCEGRLALGTPPWLISCYTLCLAGAFMYLLMSVWLAMNASVTAKSYEVRLLTQLVRLPMPTWAQVEGARTYASSFEKVRAGQMFRIPFISGTQESLLDQHLPVQQSEAPASPLETIPEDDVRVSCDLWGLETPGYDLYELDGKVRVDPSQLRHLRLVREAMQYWQSYDGFARVSMSMGTNQLCMAMAYYVIGYVMISNHATVAAFFTVGLFMAIAAALIRLDMSLTACEYYASVILVTTGPILIAIASWQWLNLGGDSNTSERFVISAVTPVAFAAQASWLALLLYISKVSQQKDGALLPTGFRSVMYIDVFGWISKTAAQQQQQRDLRSSMGAASPKSMPDPHASPLSAQNSPTTPGAGPASQSISYDQRGLPIPSRPESLSGAAQACEKVEVREEDFVPTTFVPWVKDDDNVKLERREKPGIMPWKIFCMATLMLIALWSTVGMSHVLRAFGGTAFQAAPILGEDSNLFMPTNLVPFNGEQRSLMEMELHGGVQITTTWPHMGIRPNGFSCNGDETTGLWIAVSSRFNTFAAQVPPELSASKHKKRRGIRMSFEATPACPEVEGEALQDVSVHCNSSNSAFTKTQDSFLLPSSRAFLQVRTPAMSSKASASTCSMVVLHKQGQRLTACPLPGSTSDQMPPLAGAVGTAWLDEAGVEGEPQEEVAYVALGGAACKGHAPCAYAHTTGRRIVELEVSGGNWLPTRVLHAAGPTRTAGRNSAGGLSVAGDEHKNLILFHPEEQALESVRLQYTTDTLDDDNSGNVSTSKIHRLRLPEDEQWAAACSVGKHVYLLADGLQPQLWRFPLPVELQSDSII